MLTPLTLGRLLAAGGVLAAVLSGQAQTPPDQLLLKDYHPRSIYKIPETPVKRARFPVIDVHCHNYVHTAAEVAHWVQTMDEVGLEETIHADPVLRKLYRDNALRVLAQR